MKMKRQYRTIDAQVEPESEGRWRLDIEDELRQQLAHPLVTGLKFRWEYPKDEYGQDVYDECFPDLMVTATLKKSQHDWPVYEVCEKVATSRYIAIRVYYGQDENYPCCFWDDSCEFYPW